MILRSGQESRGVLMAHFLDPDIKRLSAAPSRNKCPKSEAESEHGKAVLCREKI